MICLEEDEGEASVVLGLLSLDCLYLAMVARSCLSLLVGPHLLL